MRLKQGKGWAALQTSLPQSCQTGAGVEGRNYNFEGFHRHRMQLVTALGTQLLRRCEGPNIPTHCTVR